MVLQIAEYLRKLSRKERGFTLIELVIVVAIIAILIAVAIPIYQNVTRSAAEKAHDTNLRTIDSAVQAYFMDKGEYPADIATLTSGDKIYLETPPAVPALLVEDKANSLDYTGNPASEVDNAYYLHKVANKGTWAGPLGKGWKGYRQAP